MTDTGVERDPTIRRWASTILGYISESPAVLCRNGTFNQEVATDEAGKDKTRNMVQELAMVGLKPFDFALPLTGRLPLPTSSPLFHAVSADPCLSLQLTVSGANDQERSIDGPSISSCYQNNRFDPQRMSWSRYRSERGISWRARGRFFLSLVTLERESRRLVCIWRTSFGLNTNQEDPFHFLWT